MKSLSLPLLFLLALSTMACGPQEMDYGPEELDFEGAEIDAAPVKPLPAEVDQAAPQFLGKYRRLSIQELSLEELGEEGREDLLDAMLYPDEYTDEERKFPEQVQAFHDTDVALRGYMIPSHQEGSDVLSFLTVGDLLACCFGSAPRNDQWVDVTMAKGKTCEYYAFVPIIIKGRFKIEVIEDEAGYPAGCYRLEAESVEREN